MRSTISEQTKLDKKNQFSLWAYNQLLVFFCLVGLGLSLYSYTVELAMEGNKNYKPYCDISPHMSCTKAFGSSYGKGLGIFGENSIFNKPNSFFGIVFYSMVATLSLVNSPITVTASLVLIISSNFASLYFMYVLYFILKDLCLVCIGTYIVNVTNLLLITSKFKKIREINRTELKRQKSNLKKKPE
ncbi:vitamin K epoxide reductase complex subunit 1 [Dendroctonus ponderosae]|uniref:vitamin-K-epoxide reductase (warfarin-sensitive) n=1 Tax=Dendroctonus ponderosae TaxID=77166 RepID=J3JUW5_DENPD